MKYRRAGMKFILIATIGVCGVAGCGNGDPIPPTPTPPKGYALAIGLNEVDPAHYGGWDGALTGCEPDVEDMAKIADDAGFEVVTLITQAATRNAVLERLQLLADDLYPQDVLVVSYSGHGGSVPDQNGDETDGLDETWVLYDGQLIDDELAQAWSNFKEGVRIFFLSDSCHSGTVLRRAETPEPRMLALPDRWLESRQLRFTDEMALLEHPRMLEAARTTPNLEARLQRHRARLDGPGEAQPPEEEEPDIFTIRAMPPGVAVQTYEMHRDFYTEKGEAAPRESDVVIAASVLSISGCEDHQYSADLGFNGLFTFKLKEVWNAGAFDGSHPDFHQQILEAVVSVNASQSPAINRAGQPDLGFEEAKPYTVPQ